MTHHMPHTLDEEFPGQTDRIRNLRASSSQFTRLTDEYNDVNEAIHRAETRAEPISEEAEQDLRRLRLRLKDEIATMLAERPA